MLDQDTARALLTIADEAGARVAFVGDRHQLPAVGRGGVLDHAVAWAHPTAVVTLETVHRFTDEAYAILSLRMRKGYRSDEVFDALLARGQIVVHPTDVERTAALARLGAAGDLVIADTREQVADLNAAIRAQRTDVDPLSGGRPTVTTSRGETTHGRRPGRDAPQRPRPRRREPPDLDRDRHGRRRLVTLHDRGRDQIVPAEYAASTSSSPTPPPSTEPRARPSPDAHVALDRHHRRRSGVRRHDPRPRRQHGAPRRRDPRGRPAAVGRRRSAATAPTSAPPTPATPPSTTSTGTDPRCDRKRPHRPGNDGTESGNNSTPVTSVGDQASRSGVDNFSELSGDVP